MRRRLGILVTGVLGFASSSCGSAGDPVVGCGVGDPMEDGRLRVAVTVAPLTNLVGLVAAGTSTEVSGVVPEGVDSHTFEPSPSLAATLERADVVFVNGLGLEEPVRELALANQRRGAELCELGTTVLPPEEYVFDRSFPEAAGDPNPHLWTNPPMVADYVALIRDTLVARDPEGAPAYRRNAAVVSASIVALDAALREATATIPPEQRLLLTYHDAYAYFADTYGWTVVGAVQPSSFDEPTPREVADLVDQVRELGVAAVFGSEVFPSPVLRQLAVETGATYVGDLRDDDLPGDAGDAEHSWFAMMQLNYTTIVDAVGGDASPIAALEPPGLADGATYP